MAKVTPRFRKELPAAATDAEGAPGVQVTDPETGTSFTFYEFEYDLAHQLDGQQDYDEVIAWAAANYQTGLSPEAIDEFAAKLGELGFLDLSVMPAMPAMPSESQKSFTSAAAASPDSLKDVTESGAVLDAITAVTSSGVPQPITSTVSGRLSGGFTRSGERRQPPAPGEVVPTAFEDVSMRFRAPPPERQRSSTGIVVTLLVFIVAGAGGGYYYYMRRHPKAPEAVRLRVIAPQPTAVYRWFASAGTVVDLDARTLSFETQGKIIELMPAGTKFAAGDVLGKLQGAGPLEAELAKQRSKLAVFEQLRDSMKASGKKADLRDAEDKVTARKKMVDDVQTSLAKLVLRAPEAGSIVETTGKVGTLVAAKAPVLKWRGRNLHGDFTMDQEDFAKASKLEFCRVEVAPAAGAASATPSDASSLGAGEPRYVDCMLPPPAPPPVNGVPNLLRKFIVTLPTDAGLVTGQQLHLARKRYDGVFPLPLSAVQTVDETEAKIWVAAPNGLAEQRTVTVAESRDEVLIAAGINVGDEVIAEPPEGLTPGTLVEPIK
jgi:multidrug efflux pump subunit AcrA (membrane-fusion protein)